MAFYRLKTVKGKPYLYKVENKWTKKGPRQKVSAYIGRVLTFKIKEGKSFEECLKKSVPEYVASKDIKKVIGDILDWELKRHSVKDVEINMQDRKVLKDGKNVAIKMHDGYLCNETLTNLIDFVPQGTREDGFRLAKSFVDAGIEVPKDVFIEVFQKLQKNLKKQ